MIDWAAGAATQWIKPDAPEAMVSRLQKSTRETFTTREGVKVPMIVTRPAKCATEPCPVVVNFHDGPDAQARVGFNPRAQVFASSGFVYVEPNVRGSRGAGRTSVSSDDGVKRLEVVSDFEDLSQYIKKNWAKNGQVPKIGATGEGYGGYATFLVMTRFAGSYDAGVAISGPSNLESFLKNGPPYESAIAIAEYGDPVKDRDALQKLSPITYIKDVKAPLMIIQGVNDPRVPAGEAVQMHNELKSRGIETSLILFPDEGHGARKRDNQVLELGHTLQFFQKNLLK
ncbi:MAG: S9 family peptidase [Proteobacteria bacterium]|nr:MAG: S9 family peptidase [Pseudomonadota bacterium]